MKKENNTLKGEVNGRPVTVTIRPMFLTRKEALVAQLKDLKHGVHNITVKENKIVVESNFGRAGSVVSKFELNEYEKAMECYERLCSESDLHKALRGVK